MFCMRKTCFLRPWDSTGLYPWLACRMVVKLAVVKEAMYKVAKKSGSVSNLRLTAGQRQGTNCPRLSSSTDRPAVFNITFCPRHPGCSRQQMGKHSLWGSSFVPEVNTLWSTVMSMLGSVATRAMCVGGTSAENPSGGEKHGSEHEHSN